VKEREEHFVANVNAPPPPVATIHLVYEVAIRFEVLVVVLKNAIIAIHKSDSPVRRKFKVRDIHFSVLLINSYIILPQLAFKSKRLK
jgi:hypothetical protein